MELKFAYKALENDLLPSFNRTLNGIEIDLSLSSRDAAIRFNRTLNGIEIRQTK